jgi:hypothetical protein
MSRPIDLKDYLLRQKDWSERAFGEGRRTEGICKHIEKELAEIRAYPEDIMEWVDVAILALDGAWRAGYTPDERRQWLLSSGSTSSGSTRAQRARMTPASTSGNHEKRKVSR